MSDPFFYAKNMKKKKKVKSILICPHNGKKFTLSYNPETRIYERKVTRSKHCLRVAGNSYAYCTAAIDSMTQNKDALGVVLFEQDTNKILFASLDSFKNYGQKWTGNACEQIALAEKYWRI